MPGFKILFLDAASGAGCNPAVLKTEVGTLKVQGSPWHVMESVLK